MSAITLKMFLAESRQAVDQALGKLVPSDEVEPQKLHAAIRWSLFAGGKRFRPALVFAVGRTFGASESKLVKTAAALEMIHTYSLIHDDLPAMDNDDLRRGRLTCHKKFDEATAILAGDVLQTLAFAAIAEDESLSPAKRLKIISETARAAGTPTGMVAGQVFDIEGEKRIVSPLELEKIHHAKTGAMIIAAARCGAIIGNADDGELEKISNYAARLGLLFQITDDLLDVTATAEDLGKTPGKDAQAEKATYPALFGFTEAQTLAAETHRQSCEILDSINRSVVVLRDIADYILHRKS